MIKKPYILERGTTLLETLVTTALLAFILMFVIYSVLNMNKSVTTVLVSRDINNTATAALDRMSRSIRDAMSVDEVNSIFDTSPGKLIITSANAVGGEGEISFYIDLDSNLLIKDGIAPAMPLLTDNVIVESIIFRHLKTGKGDGVRVELTVINSKPDNVSQTRKFYSTIVLRESYQ
ncbi:MAG TPA: hypothetical protein VJJ22_02495 [Candidatus Paceibacterota bacterium]